MPQDGDYEGSDPRLRHTYVRTSPASSVHAEPPATGDGRAARPQRTAVIAWHGMGQQLPYQTLDDVARGLANTVTLRAKAVATLVQLGSERLRRVELALEDGHGGARRVDVYEVYWAPLTQGKITLTETFLFLLSAAWQGIRYGLWPPRVLHRYLFNRWVGFPLKSRLALMYLIVLLALLALVIVNFVVTSAVSVKLLTGAGDPSTWPSYDLLGDLTVDLGGLAAVSVLLFLTFGAAYLAQKPNRRQARTSERHGAIRALIWALVGLSIVVELAVGGLVLYHLYAHSGLGDVPAWPEPVAALLASWRSGDWPGPGARLGLTIGVWGLAFAGAMAVRSFLLEFAGDAAIYTWSHKLNRFYETRETIKNRSLAIARAIYEFGGYDRHVLMGHSLGSVMAYDTLNGLIVEDTIAGGRLKAAPRTALLLTYGSILDKTAFLFRAQSEFSDVREGVASAMQPLISDAPARPRWVNVFSHDDVLGGSLEYYDVQCGEPRATEPASAAIPSPIENIEDPNAWIPVLAHNQYLSNETLLRILADVVTAPIGTGRPVESAEEPAAAMRDPPDC